MAMGERKKETNLSGRIHKLTVYQEVIKWKEDFRWSKFFPLLIFGFGLSLVDGVSDFNCASQAESECAELTWDPVEKNVTQWRWRMVNNTCSGIPPHYVQSLTYFFISLPLHVTAVTGLQSLLELLTTKFCSSCGQFRVFRGAAY